MQQSTYKWMGFFALIIILLGAIYLFRDANTSLIRAQQAIDKIARDRKIAMDSIAVLNHRNDSLLQSIVVYKDSLTALSKYKSKVIIKYRDQKNFVSDASIHQLDSIIRANTSIGR